MSLSSTINKVIHDGNGATTEWPFSFPVLDADHLAVIFTDVSGVETTLSPSLYGVTGIGGPSGGAVTYPLSGSAIVSGTKLTIVRIVPYTQTTVLSNQGGYYPEVVERRFDQIYMALQQLEERVNRVSLSPISEPATEQGNLALISQLQLMDILEEQGDLLTRNGSAYKRLARGAAGQFLGVDGADLAWAVPSQPVAPQGRLTLMSGEAVMTANQTGQTSVFYTPYVGANVPIYDGTAFVPTVFAERSNDLTQSGVGNAGPAPAGPYQVIDAFVWNDAGTLRLTRGPKWTRNGTVTMTIATPCVVTWSAHGLYDGATVRFTTTGALPTGVAANVDYFATKVDANSFKLSTTLANQVAGTFIASSGSQSGVHTGENHTTARGTGVATTELERLDGIWVNKHDIANGPTARRGTYVGTMYTNGSSQIDFKFGGAAIGGDEAIIGLWNAYNRVDVSGSVLETALNWIYIAAVWRATKASAGNRASFVCGLREEFADGTCFGQCYDGSGAFSAGEVGVGFNSTQAPCGPNVIGPTTNAISLAQLTGVGSGQAFGLSYLSGLEFCSSNGSGTNAFYSSALGSAAGYTSGLSYQWRY